MGKPSDARKSCSRLQTLPDSRLQLRHPEPCRHPLALDNHLGIIENWSHRTRRSTS
jgi:hypothetical protein